MEFRKILVEAKTRLQDLESAAGEEGDKPDQVASTAIETANHEDSDGVNDTGSRDSSEEQNKILPALGSYKIHDEGILVADC